MFEPIIQTYGPPRANTAVSLESLGLAHSAALAAVAAELGGGVFGGGIVSLLSVRERVGGLGGWEKWLPAGARLFASTASGYLFATRGEDVWVVGTQYGEVMEGGLSLEETVLEFAEPETRDEILEEHVFKAWDEMAGPLPSESVLSPTPALPLGGSWTATDLVPTPLEVYLQFTAQLFTPGVGPESVRIHRLDDDEEE